MFQSTHPHGVRRRGQAIKTHSACFNPRTHTGCDVVFRVGQKPHRRFNPRTHTGCDAKTREEFVAAYKFQSTHPHGVRLHQMGALRHVNVSIHAPTRGATILTFRITFAAMFQSTHPHGVRHRAICFFSISFKFQSTHPHGVRPRIPWVLSQAFAFQSTHPHGVRPVFDIVTDINV